MNRILIVDDKEEALYLLQKLLAGNGYTVEMARHGAEALVKARQSPPDLIISDLLMPVMDGYTLLRHWKTDPRLKHVPFVVYTATYTEPKDEQLALDLGADAFILKPAEPEPFIARIRAVLAAERTGALTPTKEPADEEKALLKEYSQVLICKLEEKALQLQQANQALEADIARRKQAEGLLRNLNRVHAMLSNVNQTIVREKDTPAMLEAICRIAVEKGKFRMAWVGLFNPETQELQPAASSGVVDGYIDLVKMNLRDETRSTGPAARGLLAGEHAICNDITRDPLFPPWRQEALRRGYQSSGAFPLKAEGRVVGVFILYAGATGFFDEEEIQLLDELAADVSFALEVGRREKERRLAEAELRWRTAFFEAQVDSALDGILVVDSQGRKILQNQRLNELWKIPPDISGNKDDAAQIEFVANHTKHPKQFTQKVLYLNSHPDEVSRDEVELVDGTVLDRYSSPVRDKAGNYYGRIWTFRDITERKRADESVARLAKAVEQSAETIIITDTRGTILYTNPAFEKTTGYTRAEALGQNPSLLKSGKHDAEFYRRMWEVLGRGEIRSGHFVNRRKDGTFIEEEASISPVRDAAGNVVNYVAVKRDVTREVQLEEQFRQAQKMEAVGQLAGGVAHDFNNLLTVILMQAEMGKGEITSADKREAWEEIIRAADRAASLTRQLLLFSRRQVMRLETLDLNEAVTGLVSMLRRILGEDIQMQLNLHRKPLWTHADAGMIDQVLLNLSVNARDAMPAGGHLIIETAEKTLDAEQAQRNSDATPGCFVVLTVRDTGGGIPPEVLPRIFEPFFTTKDVGKGTGLGLATVFGIVKQHLGWIEVQSAPGEGAIFHIYLPASESPGSAKAVRATKPKSHGGSETILLVEDELAMRKVVRRALQQAGYRVLEAADGPAALSLSGQPGSEIDLLLTDLVMPEGMDGRELAALLLSARTNLKVIFMSGYSPELAGRQITLQPGQEFIQKPCTLDHLLEAVRRCLES